MDGSIVGSTRHSMGTDTMPKRESAYHPQLEKAASRLPRWVVRWWTLPVLGWVVFLTSLMFRHGERIPLKRAAVWRYRPAKGAPRPGPAILWIHGGGMIIGDARQDQDKNQALADELGVPVVSVQYRLSARHPFPAGLDDCMEAFEWLLSQPDVDPRLVVVMGESGGAGLAAQLVLRALAEQKALPCLQALSYPMLDDRSSDAAHPQERLYISWDTASNRLAWDRYLAGHDRHAPPRFSVPGRETSLRGLPPAWIGVGTLDLFHDEVVDFARGLQAAGVPTELRVVPGGFHGFDNYVADSEVAREYRSSQLAAIRRRWAELGWVEDPPQG